MPAPLRAWYTPAEIEGLAARGAALSDRFDLGRLPRFAEYTDAESAVVSAVFEFDSKELSWQALKLRFDASIWLPCQRCLQPMQLDMTDQVSFGIVNSDGLIAALPQQVEPLVHNGDRLNLIGLLEDELIVAVPFAPKHMDTNVCAVRMSTKS